MWVYYAIKLRIDQFIIPVCLPGNIYTFIPIQVKIPSGNNSIARNMDLTRHFNFHQVTVEQKSIHSVIFEDQLSIFISFKENESETATIKNYLNRVYLCVRFIFLSISI